MSDTKKMFFRVLPVVLVLCLMLVPNVFAFSNFTSDMNIESNKSIGTANAAVYRVWGTVCLILQVLAVAAIVIAGVRYMFASADAKADIKKQSVGLVVGAILVFAASTIVSFIVNVTSEVTTGSTTTKSSGT